VFNYNHINGNLQVTSPVTGRVCSPFVDDYSNNCCNHTRGYRAERVICTADDMSDRCYLFGLGQLSFIGSAI